MYVPDHIRLKQRPQTRPHRHTCVYLHMFAWLAREGRATTLEMATGFLSCSQEAVGSGVRFSNLPITVKEMLDSFGYDRDSAQNCS